MTRRRVAVLGAGPIGCATAAYLTLRGDDVAIWSRRARGTAGPVTFVVTGAIEGMFAVRHFGTLAPLADFDVVILALPATAYLDVLPSLAENLHDHHAVLFGGALSLAPLWLHEMAGKCGRKPMIVAWGTTLMAASFLSAGELFVPFVRKRFDVAALPAVRTPEATALCRTLCGIDFEAARTVLDTSLSNMNPIAHAGQLIANFSRVDRQEDWRLFENFTQSAVNLAEALDAERQMIAAAYGARTRTLRQHMAASYDVADDTVAAMSRQIADGGSRSLGAKSRNHRHLAEDMPYGLAFYERLANCARLDVPAIGAALTVLELMCGANLRGANEILDRVVDRDAGVAEIIARCTA
jgi:opine dehydrogenase